ncbi:MAG: hypothetical protein IT385_18915 [Deltaproteobacteria bacterium]|nr:hypothetical protein [Deltaproteobacteria bacterium]
MMAKTRERVIEGALLLVPIVLVFVYGTFGSEAGALVVRAPADDEVLLSALVDPERQATFAREAELRRRPGDVRLAIEVARRHIEDARRNNDPRALGWAEAALAPFTSDPAATPDVRVLRATIRQSRHDFAGALADLDLALAADPDHAQAALGRATIKTITGRPADARADCEVVRRSRALPIVSAVCNAAIDGLTGHAEQGRRRIDAVLELDARAPPALLGWALATRGELGRALGDLDRAEADLRRALELAPGDATIAAALSDLLLERGRPAEVLTLVGASDVDALVLRRALATLATGGDASADVATVRARADAARARGDVMHLREEARLALGVDRDAARALELALASWQVHKEVPDMRLALEAALAAGQPQRATPIVAHARESGLVDARVDDLVRRVVEATP